MFNPAPCQEKQHVWERTLSCWAGGTSVKTSAVSEWMLCKCEQFEARLFDNGTVEVRACDQRQRSWFRVRELTIEER